MTKRNTEGYVLAYLLIVIAVLGVIGASLMTSTLQVVQAQEKSLVYMKDKYEAMGEVEKFVAALSSLSYNHEDSSGNQIFGFTDDENACNNDAENRLWTILLPDLISEYSSLEITCDDSLRNNSLNVVYKPSHSSTKIVADISFNPFINISRQSGTEERTYLDPETGDEIPEFVSVTYYSYSISLSDLIFESYEITSLEVTPNEED